MGGLAKRVGDKTEPCGAPAGRGSTAVDGPMTPLPERSAERPVENEVQNKMAAVGGG